MRRTPGNGVRHIVIDYLIDMFRRFKTTAKGNLVNLLQSLSKYKLYLFLKE